MAGLKDERTENVDSLNCESRKLAERGNRQNGPCPRRITLVGDDLAGNTQRAAQYDKRKPHGHKFRAPKHPHSSERRQDALPHAQDHHRDEPNCQSMTRRSPNSTRGIPASRCNAKGRGDDKPEVGHANEERKTGMRAPDCPRER